MTDKEQEPKRGRKRNRETPMKRMPGGVWAPQKSAPTTPVQKRTKRGGRPRVGLDRDEATTAHCCTLYPFGLHSGLGIEGAYLGFDQLGGGEAFFFDPFVVYRDHSHLGASNTNMLVLGKPGLGKSALVKTMLLRLGTVYGEQRYFAILDVKGEYTSLAERLGLTIVRLSAGGSVRINPLDRTGDENDIDRQTKFIEALLATVLDRDLSNTEKALVWHSVETVNHYEHQATLSDLAKVLATPSEGAAKRALVEIEELQGYARELVVALDKLLTRDLRGMFDGRSTERIDVATGRGLVLDLSAANQNEEILPLVMTASVAWLQQLMTVPGRYKVMLLDEFWRMASREGTARFLQSCWKLGRTYGASNVGVLHKPSDLGAQSDTGTAASKIAAGLVADTSIRVSFAQTAEDLNLYGDLLGFGQAEKRVIARLSRGESLWKIGEHSVLLRHVLGASDRQLVDTDQAMA